MEEEKKKRKKNAKKPSVVALIRSELAMLDLLNEATFNVFFSKAELPEGSICIKIDRTNPKGDKCVVPQGSRRRLQGDFCLVREIRDSVYVLAGDATGHYSYALGLKLFIAMAFDRIFENNASDEAQEPLSIINKLIDFFGRIDAGSGERGKLTGGADLVVLRIDRTQRSVVFASAGLPFYLLGENHLSLFGDSEQGLKGVSFPSGYLGDRRPAPPTEGRPSVSDREFIAIVTDGFEELRRRRDRSSDHNQGELEQFGRDNVIDALRKGAKKAFGANSTTLPVERVARTLVEAARNFRSKHEIPEIGEDDRQVVVIELERLWKDRGN